MSKEVGSGAQSDPQERSQTAVAFDSKNISRKADTEYFTRVTGARARKRKELARLKKEAVTKQLVEKEAAIAATKQKQREIKLSRAAELKIEKAQKREELSRRGSDGKRHRRASVFAGVLAAIILLAVSASMIFQRQNNPDEPVTPEGQASDEQPAEEPYVVENDVLAASKALESGDSETLFAVEQSLLVNNEMAQAIELTQNIIDQTQDPIVKAKLLEFRARRILASSDPQPYFDLVARDAEESYALNPSLDICGVLVEVYEKMGNTNRAAFYQEKIEIETSKSSSGQKTGEE